MPLADLITTDNINSYARAAVQIARTTIRLSREGFESIVVPSRGSVPIVTAAQTYKETVLKPLISRSDRIGMVQAGFRDPLNTVFHLPFTADAGSSGLQGVSSADIRGFWTRVLAAVTRQDFNDPYYRLYRFSRDIVCPVGHHDPYERFITSGKFIFIDTVVSGRAISEIIDAFEQADLNEFHFILLLDENGDRVDKVYAKSCARLKMMAVLH